MPAYRVLTPDQAMTLIRLADEERAGTGDVPPEIKQLRERIADAIKNAELFMALFRVVDMGMVNDIVDMKMDLDTLYGKWAINETPATIH